MKTTKTSQSTRLLLAAGLLFTAAASQAQDQISFAIDGTTFPIATSVQVKGSFDGWGAGLSLTNDGINWSGTAPVTAYPSNVIACKFIQNGSTWEDDPNREFLYNGGPQVLPLTGWDDQYGPTNSITFQVDMTQQIALNNYTPGQPMQVTGNFKNPRWGSGPQVDLTNNPALSGNASNIYSGTYPVVGISNSIAREYKFRANGGWESTANRTFVITNTTQVLPLVYYNNLPYNAPTNNVTFQVDMTAQLVANAWNPAQPIRVSGNMTPTSGGNGIDLTNNPALTGNASNVYSTVIEIVSAPGTQFTYKFRANNGWENPTLNVVPPFNDRAFQIAGGNQVLPLVYYSDTSECGYVLTDTAVTYRLQMTNGTPVPGTAITFDRSVNNVHINGEFLGWWAWYDGVAGGNGPANQMTNNPIGSDYFEQTFTLAKGQFIQQNYKYSIDGYDNEAAGGVNHVRYIRTIGGAPYTMPVDRFGTNPVPPVVEQSFGNLQVGARSGSTIPITWSGRQCVTLQASSVLTNGVNLFWTDIGATEGTSSTNFPVQAGPRYFRLLKKP